MQFCDVLADETISNPQSEISNPMHLTFLNPQGNFDPNDRYWTEHPDFGGQLVYVKEVAIALAELGHDIDIVTRQIIDPNWPEFAASLDQYPDSDRVRIVRIPCGPPHFLRKEDLWPFLGAEWVPNILDFYRQEGRLPDAITTHYADGGLCGALVEQQTGIPFTFTGHSLGAQKMDKLHATADNLAELDRRFHFSQRIAAERIAMNRAAQVIVSTGMERFEQYAHRAYQGAVDVHDDGHFAVIPPGVNLRIFDRAVVNDGEGETQAHIERMLERDIDPERKHLPVIVSSSRLDAKKNLTGLVEAFAHSQWLRDQTNLGIIVRGMTDPLREHSQLTTNESVILDDVVGIVEEHDLWGKITAFPLNSQPELAAGYRYLAKRRSVFALTALYEPFGLAPLEAMAAGLPAVVTKNGGPSESLFDAATGSVYGVLVDPTDSDDIARGLLEVAGNPETWQYYHDAGIQRVHDTYTWQRTAAGYLAVIEQILEHLEPISAYFEDPGAGDISTGLLASLYLPKPQR